MNNRPQNQISYGTPCKSMLKWLCLGALVLSTSALTAADSAQQSSPQPSTGDEGATNNTQESAPETPANASGSQKRQAGDKGGVFLPSEDISEDVAITFPVDI